MVPVAQCGDGQRMVQPMLIGKVTWLQMIAEELGACTGTQRDALPPLLLLE